MGRIYKWCITFNKLKPHKFVNTSNPGAVQYFLFGRQTRAGIIKYIYHIMPCTYAMCRTLLKPVRAPVFPTYTTNMYKKNLFLMDDFFSYHFRLAHCIIYYIMYSYIMRNYNRFYSLIRKLAELGTPEPRIVGILHEDYYYKVVEQIEHKRRETAKRPGGKKPVLIFVRIKKTFI